ncbi:MAG TPA: 50S ribosomal protein L22 [Fimbriimonas sp.]
MEVKAIARNQRVQPRKVRIIADEIRGKSVITASGLLRYHPSKGARLLRKVLISAVANAQENNGLAPENLKIATIMVDEGPRLKRMTAKAMGRGARIIKKTSHITVVVEEAEAEKAVKPHGTKAKPRPTFAAPAKKKGGSKKAEEPVAAAAPPVDEVTDTDAETVAAAEPEEATPVTASDAPEEGGSAAPVQEEVAGEESGPSADEEDNK